MTTLRMHQPPHPGEILRELCLMPLQLSVTEAASSLGVSRNTLSAILNARAGISPEMAIRVVHRLQHHGGELAASTNAIRSLARRAVAEAPSRSQTGRRLGRLPLRGEPRRDGHASIMVQ